MRLMIIPNIKPAVAQDAMIFSFFVKTRKIHHEAKKRIIGIIALIINPKNSFSILIISYELKNIPGISILN